MKRVSMATRAELIGALGERYRIGDRGEKTLIIDEFVAVTGYHRKHAMRVLRHGEAEVSSPSQRSRRVYGDAVREALVVIWEASDRICGKRLKYLVPVLVEAMERHGHLALDGEVRRRLLSMSAATIDRALRDVKEQAGGRRRRRAAPSSAIRRSVPVRTHSDWHDPPPGFAEADLVAHSGPSSKGSFLQTLVLTDIATGWTECAPLLYREQTLLSEVLTELRKLLPFDLLGFDTDNDSVFMNETVLDYCRSQDIAFTRCRPYRKNDQAHVEQKNGAVVRHMVGYRRFEGMDAAVVLARLYGALRLFVNFFQPSFKLAGKKREGALVRKTYHPPATPCQRLLADPRTPAAVREKVAALQARLDPIALLQELRMAQQQLVEIADRPATLPEEGAPPAIGPFLAGLRVAWKDHEVRPAIPGKAKPKRERRRPDPLAAVSEELRVRFEAAPWRTGRQLLVQLQADYPGIYPDALLRTLQRRLKIWRSARAHAMIFGEQPKDPASGKEAIGDREGGTNQEVEAARPAAASIDAFVSSLSTAWKDGEARPTARAKAKAKRGRRRPDPLVAVTEELRTRFEAAPWRTARQLFVELQTEHPGAYPDGLIRTLQRRLKSWRGESGGRGGDDDAGRQAAA